MSFQFDRHHLANKVTQVGIVVLGVMVTLAGLAGQTEVYAETKVSVLDEIPTEFKNDHYVSNRAPLLPGKLIKLPVGAVKADDWLLSILEKQRAGLTGNLPKLSAWLNKDDNAWLSNDGRGKWGWEEVPYWLKGYISLAYLLDDKAMEKESKIWIEGALASQRADGNFGPLRVFGEDNSQDYWANMVMMFCLQTYYEHSHDKRVLDLMTKYFEFQNETDEEKLLTHYWQHMRGGDNLFSIYWLYNRTGDEWLLDLATKIHNNTANWRTPGRLPNWHNVNIAQAFGEPATYYLQSHDPQHLSSAYENFHLVREKYGQVPGGMFGADENARTGYDDPKQAIETCGIVEQMLSDETLLRITGDTFWADHCEEVAFNSLPAAFTSDYRALRYLTSPNMITSDRHNHAPGFDNRGPMTMMNPLSHRCCQHNHSHGWPYFVENLWHATSDNGLSASMFSPSTVTAKVGTGQEVVIRQETEYPFRDTVKLHFLQDKSVEFPLYLRIPGWCNDSSVSINGEDIASGIQAGSFIRIDREWAKGDTLVLKLPMKLETTRWANNHNSASIKRGPLTFSLRIGEQYKKFDARKTALQDSQWQDTEKLEDWPAFEITPSTSWNYALVLDGQIPDQSFSISKQSWQSGSDPFTLDNLPVTLTCEAKRIPEWELDSTGLCGSLQDSPVFSDEPTEEVTLVPMGAARLRITAFPVASTTRDANRWQSMISKKPAYGVKCSQCYVYDSMSAVVDGIEPANSGDHYVPRHTFWPNTGTKEWLEAEFTEPKSVSQVGVYWFDDTKRGFCRVPESWQLMYWKDEKWNPVQAKNDFSTKLDDYNTVEFQPVETTALRLEVQLQPTFSAGVLELKFQ